MQKKRLEKYGPFSVGESLPFTNWTVKEIAHDETRGKISLALEDNGRKRSEEFDFSEEDFSKTEETQAEMRRNRQEAAELEKKLGDLRTSVFRK